jgi:hypothetical protein
MAARRPRRESMVFDDAPIPLPVKPAQKLRLSAREVGQIIGMSEYQVLNDAKAGAIPSHQVGSRTVIYRQELDEWVRGASITRRTEALKTRIDAAIVACEQAARELREIRGRL